MPALFFSTWIVDKEKKNHLKNTLVFRRSANEILRCSPQFFNYIRIHWASYERLVLKQRWNEKKNQLEAKLHSANEMLEMKLFLETVKQNRIWALLETSVCLFLVCNSNVFVFVLWLNIWHRFRNIIPKLNMNSEPANSGRF